MGLNNAQGHLPGDQRNAFLKELARVAGDSLLIAAPFSAPQVEEAESILAAFLEKRLSMEHRFLSEHRVYRLPDREQTVRALEKQVGPVAIVPNGNLHRWLLMMGLSFYLDVDPNLNQVKKEVSAYYNRHYYRSDNTEPAYRHLLLARRKPAKLPSPRDLMPGQEGPAALDFSPMSVLMEATTVDLLKGAYRSIEELQEESESKDRNTSKLEAAREEALAGVKKWQAEAELRGERIETLQQEAELRGERIETLQQEVELRGERNEAFLQEVELRGERIEALRREVELRGERIEALQGEIASLGAEVQRLRDLLHRFPVRVLRKLRLTPPV